MRRKDQARLQAARTGTGCAPKAAAGFTLTELLVVIGIMAIVSAITIPVTKTMVAGNRAMSCASRMQRVYAALRTYTQDWGATPNYYPPANGSDPVTQPPIGPGLMALVDGGYLKSTMNLHCPEDKQNPQGSATYGWSYFDVDANAAAGSGAFGKYSQCKYLSTRGISDVTDPDYGRQLCPYNAVSGLPIFSRAWKPDDTTVVFWCEQHYNKILEGGNGQYQVLFWDGSVRRMDGALFRGTLEPFRVRPSMDKTPT